MQHSLELDLIGHRTKRPTKRRHAQQVFEIIGECVQQHCRRCRSILRHHDAQDVHLEHTAFG